MSHIKDVYDAMQLGEIVKLEFYNNFWGSDLLWCSARFRSNSLSEV